MPSAETEADVLSRSLVALAPLYGARGLAALRAALRALLEVEQPAPAARLAVRAAPARRASQRASAATPSPAGWPALRQQIAAAARECGVSRAKLAKVAGTSAGTMKNLLAPSGDRNPPSAAIRRKLERWCAAALLAATSPAAPEVAAPPFRSPARNGGDADAAAGR